MCRSFGLVLMVLLFVGSPTEATDWRFYGPESAATKFPSPALTAKTLPARLTEAERLVDQLYEATESMVRELRKLRTPQMTETARRGKLEELWKLHMRRVKVGSNIQQDLFSEEATIQGNPKLKEQKYKFIAKIYTINLVGRKFLTVIDSKVDSAKAAKDAKYPATIKITPDVIDTIWISITDVKVLNHLRPDR